MTEPTRGIHRPTRSKAGEWHRPTVLAAGFLVALILMAVLAPMVTCPPGRDHQYCGALLEHPNESLRDQEGNDRLLISVAPRNELPFGTDALGRDVLSRVVYGGRGSLVVGAVTAAVVLAVGTIVGAIAGYRRGFVDDLLMRSTDLVLGLPLIPIAIVIGRVIPEIDALPVAIREGPWGIALLLGFLLWGPLARIVRGEVRRISTSGYVDAARVLGAGTTRILRHHVVPNASGPVIVQATLTIAAAIVLESALAFLGFGIQPPTATWGSMVAAGASAAVRGHWWELTFASIALVLTVLAVNQLGETSRREGGRIRLRARG